MAHLQPRFHQIPTSRLTILVFHYGLVLVLSKKMPAGKLDSCQSWCTTHARDPRCWIVGLVFVDPILHLAYNNPKKEAFQVENQWKTMMCHSVSSIQVCNFSINLESCYSWHPFYGLLSSDILEYVGCNPKKRSMFSPGEKNNLPKD